MENSAAPSAHTPGPWHLHGPFRIHIDGDILVAGMMVMSGDPESLESYPIARITGPSYLGREDECDDQLAANARLIAASPSMLDDGQSLYDAIQNYLFDIPDGELPGYLIEAFDRFEETWNSARGVES